MQIVIDIPDKVLARIRSRHGHCGSVRHGNGIWTDDLLTVSTAIYFGKILPKGHGRLGDLDALYQEIETRGWFNSDDAYYGGGLEDIVLSASTLIEADKEAYREDSN